MRAQRGNALHLGTAKHLHHRAHTFHAVLVGQQDQSFNVGTFFKRGQGVHQHRLAAQGEKGRINAFGEIFRLATRDY
jgi:hypothetical protein